MHFANEVAVIELRFLHDLQDVAIQRFAVVGRKVFGRQDDDGNLGGFRPGFQCVHDFEPADPRHHQIQDDQIRLVRLRNLQPFLATIGPQYRIARFFQIGGNDLDRPGVIVDHQNGGRAGGLDKAQIGRCEREFIGGMASAVNA